MTSYDVDKVAARGNELLRSIDEAKINETESAPDVRGV